MRENLLIVIDPGHGGPDPGAVGPTGLKESHVVLKISTKVGNILNEHKIKTMFTREEDIRVSLGQRVEIANQSKADYFVSIHINSATNINATGIETYAYKKGTAGDNLAHKVQNNLVKEVGLTDRKVKYESFKVLKETTMPAVLLEVGFINNPKEEELLKDDVFLEKAAIGIAKGILEYLGVPYISNKEKTNEKISNWAVDAMKWSTSEEVNLTDGSNLKEPVSLERMMTILYRYDKFKSKKIKHLSENSSGVY